jgi:hypothetical protein
MAVLAHGLVENVLDHEALIERWACSMRMVTAWASSCVLRCMGVALSPRARDAWRLALGFGPATFSAKPVEGVGAPFRSPLFEGSKPSSNRSIYFTFHSGGGFVEKVPLRGAARF